MGKARSQMGPKWADNFSPPDAFTSNQIYARKHPNDFPNDSPYKTRMKTIVATNIGLLRNIPKTKIQIDYYLLSFYIG